MLFVNKQFISSFPISISLTYFSCLIALARTSSTTMWKKSSERGHSCLVPDLRRKILSFSSILYSSTFIGIFYHLEFNFSIFNHVDYMYLYFPLYIMGLMLFLIKVFSK